MVTVKISKRKKMGSKAFLKRSLPFFALSLIVVIGGLFLIGRLLEGDPLRNTAQWGWFIITFLIVQYINVKYIVKK
ncbi:MAG: hypothetical protein RBS85_08065 [Methanofastidiosum sp.]|jgi:hypothetical protein|nr:hypothetical protein [Methanofastidiosum sp.]